MGSDRARNSYDARQLYRSVVMQQGRVQLEADWNEATFINSEEIRNEALDIVGPAGTPDDGYAVGFPSTLPPFDFDVAPGIMYIGGVRVWTPQSIQYGNQSDWLDNAIDPEWVPVPTANPGNEYIYLVVREQEVSAVEDSDLKDVALGGPDTAQRTRLIQHVERLATQASDCPTALAAAGPQWQKEGLFINESNMRLVSAARLTVSFVSSGSSEPCDPVAQGGYLGADNQMIRVMVSSFNPGNNTGTLLWGFDDASFLYRVNVVDPQTLTLQSAPIDAEHQPQGDQAVEVLMNAAQLANGEFVAAPVGAPFTLNPSPYNPDTLTLSLPSALPAVYGDGNPADPHPAQVYLRVWQQQLNFTPGTAVTLGDTGVAVTLQTIGAGPFHVGDYWMFAVRPSTPQQIYPERYLQDFQPPEGPREWLCPLAVIAWSASGGGQVLSDCRNQFSPLTSPAMHVTAISWSNDDLLPVDVFDQGLQVTLDADPDPTSVTSSTMIVVAEAPPASAGLSGLMTQPYIFLAEPTVAANVISWTPPPGLENLLQNLPAGTLLRVRVTLKGHVIWTNLGGTLLYLDGQAFGQPGTRSDGTTRIDLILPRSGSGARASDFESWFWLTNTPAALLQVSSAALVFVDPASGAITTVAQVTDPTQTTQVNILQTPVNGIQVTFTGATLHQSTVNQSTFIVISATGPGPLAGQITFPGPNIALWSVKGLSGGFYTVTLLGGPPPSPVIASTDKIALDGEPKSTYPSGNGTPGGNFVFQFNLFALQ